MVARGRPLLVVVAAIAVVLAATTTAWGLQSPQARLAPGAGPAGSQARLDGSGFGDATTVEVVWQPGGQVLTVASGPRFSVTVHIPDDAAAGSHAVVARGTSSLDATNGSVPRATASFTVEDDTADEEQEALTDTAPDTDSGDSASSDGIGGDGTGGDDTSTEGSTSDGGTSTGDATTDSSITDSTSDTSASDATGTGEETDGTSTAATDGSTGDAPSTGDQETSDTSTDAGDTADTAVADGDDDATTGTGEVADGDDTISDAAGQVTEPPEPPETPDAVSGDNLVSITGADGDQDGDSGDSDAAGDGDDDAGDGGDDGGDLRQGDANDHRADAGAGQPDSEMSGVGQAKEASARDGASADGGHRPAAADDDTLATADRVGDSRQLFGAAHPSRPAQPADAGAPSRGDRFVAPHPTADPSQAAPATLAAAAASGWPPQLLATPPGIELVLGTPRRVSALSPSTVLGQAKAPLVAEPVALARPQSTGGTNEASTSDRALMASNGGAATTPVVPSANQGVTLMALLVVVGALVWHRRNVTTTGRGCG